MNLNFINFDPLPAISTLGGSVSDSICYFNASGTLLYANDKFGTLRHARATDLRDYNTVFRYYCCRYDDAYPCRECVEEVYDTGKNVGFSMNHDAGWVALCEALPITASSTVIGVMIVARKEMKEAMARARSAVASAKKGNEDVRAMVEVTNNLITSSRILLQKTCVWGGGGHLTCLYHG